MSADDELLQALAAALEPPDRRPPPAAVDALRHAAAANPTRAHLRVRGRRRLILVSVAVAAAMAGFAGAQVVEPLQDRSGRGVQEFAGLLRSDDGSRRADLEIVRVGVGRIVRLQSDTLPILPNGEFYEVWFVGPGDAPGSPNRISAGTFHPDAQGRTSVVLLAAVDPRKRAVVEVTAEPGDGEPRPSGPVVVRAQLVVRG